VSFKNALTFLSIMILFISCGKKSNNTPLQKKIKIPTHQHSNNDLSIFDKFTFECSKLTTCPSYIVQVMSHQESHKNVRCLGILVGEDKVITSSSCLSFTKTPTKKNCNDIHIYAQKEPKAIYSKRTGCRSLVQYGNPNSSYIYRISEDITLIQLKKNLSKDIAPIDQVGLQVNNYYRFYQMLENSNNVSTLRSKICQIKYRKNLSIDESDNLQAIKESGQFTFDNCQHKIENGIIFDFSNRMMGLSIFDKGNRETLLSNSACIKADQVNELNATKCNDSISLSHVHNHFDLNAIEKRKILEKVSATNEQSEISKLFKWKTNHYKAEEKIRVIEPYCIKDLKKFKKLFRNKLRVLKKKKVVEFTTTLIKVIKANDEVESITTKDFIVSAEFFPRMIKSHGHVILNLYEKIPDTDSYYSGHMLHRSQEIRLKVCN
jgi:hypothetical protein